MFNLESDLILSEKERHGSQIVNTIHAIIKKKHKNNDDLIVLDSYISDINFFKEQRSKQTSVSYQHLLKHINFQKNVAGQAVIKSGDKGYKFYVIAKGTAAVLLKKDDQKVNKVPIECQEKYKQMNLFEVEIDENEELEDHFRQTNLNTSGLNPVETVQNLDYTKEEDKAFHFHKKMEQLQSNKSLELSKSFDIDRLCYDEDLNDSGSDDQDSGSQKKNRKNLNFFNDLQKSFVKSLNNLNDNSHTNQLLASDQKEQFLEDLLQIETPKIGEVQPIYKTPPKKTFKSPHDRISNIPQGDKKPANNKQFTRQKSLAMKSVWQCVLRNSNLTNSESPELKPKPGVNNKDGCAVNGEPEIISNSNNNGRSDKIFIKKNYQEEENTKNLSISKNDLSQMISEEEDLLNINNINNHILRNNQNVHIEVNLPPKSPKKPKLNTGSAEDKKTKPISDNRKTSLVNHLDGRNLKPKESNRILKSMLNLLKISSHTNLDDNANKTNNLNRTAEGRVSLNLVHNDANENQDKILIEDHKAFSRAIDQYLAPLAIEEKEITKPQTKRDKSSQGSQSGIGTDGTCELSHVDLKYTALLLLEQHLWKLTDMQDRKYYIETIFPNYTLKIQNAGHSFGEMALLAPNFKRSSTIICMESCEFLTLGKKKFQNILFTLNDLQLKKEMAILKNFIIFKRWVEDYTQPKLCVMLQHVSLEKREHQFREGDNVNCFWILKEGIIRVYGNGKLEKNPFQDHLSEIEKKNIRLLKKVEKKCKYHWEVLLKAPIMIGEEDLNGEFYGVRSISVDVCSSKADFQRITSKDVYEDLVPKCPNIFEILAKSAQAKKFGYEKQKRLMKEIKKKQVQEKSTKVKTQALIDIIFANKLSKEQQKEYDKSNYENSQKNNIINGTQYALTISEDIKKRKTNQKIFQQNDVNWFSNVSATKDFIGGEAQHSCNDNNKFLRKSGEFPRTNRASILIMEALSENRLNAFTPSRGHNTNNQEFGQSHNLKTVLSHNLETFCDNENLQKVRNGMNLEKLDTTMAKEFDENVKICQAKLLIPAEKIDQYKDPLDFSQILRNYEKDIGDKDNSLDENVAESPKPKKTDDKKKKLDPTQEKEEAIKQASKLQHAYDVLSIPHYELNKDGVIIDITHNKDNNNEKKENFNSLMSQPKYSKNFEDQIASFNKHNANLMNLNGLKPITNLEQIDQMEKPNNYQNLLEKANRNKKVGNVGINFYNSGETKLSIQADRRNQMKKIRLGVVGKRTEYGKSNNIQEVLNAVGQKKISKEEVMKKIDNFAGLLKNFQDDDKNFECSDETDKKTLKKKLVDDLQNRNNAFSDESKKDWRDVLQVCNRIKVDGYVRSVVTEKSDGGVQLSWKSNSISTKNVEDANLMSTKTFCNTHYINRKTDDNNQKNCEDFLGLSRKSYTQSYVDIAPRLCKGRMNCLSNRPMIGNNTYSSRFDEPVNFGYGGKKVKVNRRCNTQPNSGIGNDSVFDKFDKNYEKIDDRSKMNLSENQKDNNKNELAPIGGWNSSRNKLSKVEQIYSNLLSSSLYDKYKLHQNFNPNKSIITAQAFGTGNNLSVERNYTLNNNNKKLTETFDTDDYHHSKILNSQPQPHQSSSPFTLPRKSINSNKIQQSTSNLHNNNNSTTDMKCAVHTKDHFPHRNSLYAKIIAHKANNSMANQKRENISAKKFFKKKDNIEYATSFAIHKTIFHDAKPRKSIEEKRVGILKSTAYSQIRKNSNASDNKTPIDQISTNMTNSCYNGTMTKASKDNTTKEISEGTIGKLVINKKKKEEEFFTKNGYSKGELSEEQVIKLGTSWNQPKQPKTVQWKRSISNFKDVSPKCSKRTVDSSPKRTIDRVVTFENNIEESVQTDSDDSKDSKYFKNEPENTPVDGNTEKESRIASTESNRVTAFGVNIENNFYIDNKQRLKNKRETTRSGIEHVRMTSNSEKRADCRFNRQKRDCHSVARFFNGNFIID